MLSEKAIGLRKALELLLRSLYLQQHLSWRGTQKVTVLLITALFCSSPAGSDDSGAGKQFVGKILIRAARAVGLFLESTLRPKNAATDGIKVHRVAVIKTSKLFRLPSFPFFRVLTFRLCSDTQLDMHRIWPKPSNALKSVPGTTSELVHWACHTPG